MGACLGRPDAVLPGASRRPRVASLTSTAPTTETAPTTTPAGRAAVAAAGTNRTNDEPMMPTKEKKKDESKRRLKGLQLFRRSKSKQSPTSSPSAPTMARSASVSTPPGADDAAPAACEFSTADGSKDSTSDISSLTAELELPEAPPPQPPPPPPAAEPAGLGAPTAVTSLPTLTSVTTLPTSVTTLPTLTSVTMLPTLTSMTTLPTLTSVTTLPTLSSVTTLPALTGMTALPTLTSVTVSTSPVSLTETEWTPLALVANPNVSHSVTVTSGPEQVVNGLSSADSRLTEKVRKVEELEVKIRQMKTDVDRVTVQGNQGNVDPNIIRAMIMEKMKGMGGIKEQVTDMQPEPAVSLPETPQNGVFVSVGKGGPLASLNFPSSPDAVSSTQVTTSNTSTRFAAKRSQVLTTRATTSTSSSSNSELKSSLQAEASGAQSELQNFNRKVSQTQIGAANGPASDVTCVTSSGRVAGCPTALTAAGQRESPAGAARAALQSQNSAAALASAANVRQLAKSFDSLKSMSMDKLKDSLSMEKLDDRDLLNIDLGGDGQDGGHDPNVQVFEQKQSYSTSNKKLVTNDFSTEEATANSEEMTRLQEGDSSYRENKASSDMRAKLEINGVTAEKGLSTRQEARQLKSGDLTHQESRSAAVAGAKLSADGFSTQKVAMEQNQQRQTKAAGVVNQEQRSKKSTHSKVTINKQGVTTPDSQAVAFAVDELDRLERSTNPLDVSQAVIKCSHHMAQMLRGLDSQEPEQQVSVFDQMDAMMRRAWSVPTYGHELGNSLCDVIRDNGGLDLLIRSCDTGSKEVDLKSARVLEQCLTTENRQYVVERGLDSVVRSACRTCSEKAEERESRVGSGILEHLFKHSEDTCSDVVRMGGLDAVITQCRNKDLETLRHCASALANLSLYGGPENQQAMMKRKVPTWLFPLAFHSDDNIKYYACLAITSMVANKEIEAAVLKSRTLDLVEPFVTSHDPDQFSKSTVAHVHGQSRSWLKRLVPVLLSDREEARKLAAFHFCMEAGIKIRQGCPEIFEEIGAIEPLKQVASSPNAVASKYAAQALHLLGQEVPHKLSQQVPLWSVEDVKEWVKQINFSPFAEDFVRSRMDGDLLLRMTEDMLKEDIGMANGILRNRFMRELNNLKKMADYSSCDSTGLNAFLQSIGPEFSVYTYTMLMSGVDKDCLRYLTDEQLQYECDISNSIHRLRIHEAIKNESAPSEVPEDMDKTLDCFISYRRSNGSQLASLLKVHLELRGFSVFIDVERLEAGKFDNNLLNSIRQAHNFILVLTPSALDRCIQDYDQKDWVHKEVYAALQSKCNIIPIIDNFQWPEAEELPEDIKAVCTFNGVRWIHDYQEACVDKLERFMRGDVNRADGRLVPGVRGQSPMGPARAQSPCLSRGQSPARWTPSRPPMSPLSPRRLLQYQRRASPVVSGARRREMTRSRSLDAILDSESGQLVNESQFLSRSEDELGCCRDEDAAPETPSASEPPPAPAAAARAADAEREPSTASEASRDSDTSRQGRHHKASLVGRTFNKMRHMITKDSK